MHDCKCGPDVDFKCREVLLHERRDLTLSRVRIGNQHAGTRWTVPVCAPKYFCVPAIEDSTIPDPHSSHYDAHIYDANFSVALLPNQHDGYYVCRSWSSRIFCYINNNDAFPLPHQNPIQLDLDQSQLSLPNTG